MMQVHDVKKSDESQQKESKDHSHEPPVDKKENCGESKREI